MLYAKPLLKTKYNARAICSFRKYVLKFVVCLHFEMSNNCRSAETTRKTRACWVVHGAQTPHSCVFRYTQEARFPCVLGTQQPRLLFILRHTKQLSLCFLQQTRSTHMKRASCVSRNMQKLARCFSVTR